MVYRIEIMDCCNHGKLNKLMNLVDETVFHDAVDGTAFILYYFKALP
jgi:hypothetical protein